MLAQNERRPSAGCIQRRSAPVILTQHCLPVASEHQTTRWQIFCPLYYNQPGAIMSTLRPVSRVTLAEQVATQISDQISEGRWKPGEKLPTEAELCNALRIGRSTLREALKSLAFVAWFRCDPVKERMSSKNLGSSSIALWPAAHSKPTRNFRTWAKPA